MGPTTSTPNYPLATVCVTNLPSGTSEADIRELFSEYGSLQRVMLLPAEPYQSVQCHGYFDLSSDDVDRAVTGVDGHLFKGAIIRVSHVPHRPLPPEVPKDHPAGVTPHTDDEIPTIGIANRYEVATVEKALAPEGGQGDDWYRYLLSSGRSQIAGLHRGTLDEVLAHATSCAELVNSRSVTGKSTRTYAPSKKK